MSRKERIMLVLDFDGNLTDAEREGEPFVDGYLKDLKVLLGLQSDEFTRLVVEARKHIAAHLETDGWCVDGEIVAPPNVDPYIRTNTIGRRLLKTVVTDRRLREAIQQVLYSHNYRLTIDSFKPWAIELLIALSQRHHRTFIVTNSSTDNVVGKINRGLLMGVPLCVDGARQIEEAMAWWRDRVIGHARKFDPRPIPSRVHLPKVPVRTRFEGFPRYTLILRPHYLLTLDTLTKGKKIPFNWGRMVVVGDIFELDLALPLVLGCHIGLMANEHTPPWEVEFVRSHERGRVLGSVNEILPYYDEVQAKIRG